MLHQEDDLPNIKLNRADNLWWESFLSSFPGWFPCSNMLDTFAMQSIGAREQESMRAWKHDWCGAFWFYDILAVCRQLPYLSCCIERMIFQISSSTELTTCDENLFCLLFPADLHAAICLIRLRCRALGQESMRAWEHESMIDVALFDSMCQ